MSNETEWETPEEVQSELDDALTTDEELLAFDVLNVGRQTFSTSILGHQVVIRTPSVGEEIEALAMTKEYAGSEAVIKVWKLAAVASVIEEIDGVPVYVPIQSSETSVIGKKFNILKKYHASFIDGIYEFYNQKTVEIAKVIEKLGKDNG